MTINSAACELGVATGAGAAGAVACLPLSPVGNVICGAVGGLVGGIIGYIVCQDPTGEGIRVDLTCFDPDRCRVELNVASFNRPALSVDTQTYWDLKGKVDFVLGAIPCRPACGDHSITLHSNSGRQFVRSTALPDPNNPGQIRTLYDTDLSTRLLDPQPVLCATRLGFGHSLPST